MANVFKNYVSESIGTVDTTVYTVPANTTAVIIGLNIANLIGSQVTADVKLGTTHIVKAAPIPSGSALSVLDGKIVLEAADTIKVTSSANTSLDVILSAMEQS